MIFSSAYLLSIVAINVGFAHVALWHGWPPLSLAVGLVFVLRDFAQREIGDRVVWLMLAGVGISYVMATPEIALASAAAFAVGEGVDMLVFKRLKRPLADRVLISSVFGTPLDSIVFLALIGHFSWLGVALMTASKMVGAVVAYALLRRQVRA